MPAKSRAKLHMIISLLKEKGAAVPMPYFRHIKGEIYELRIISGHDSFRILCFFTHSREIVLTNGFRKTTLRTPEKEIKVAEKRLSEFKRSNAE